MKRTLAVIVLIALAVGVGIINNYADANWAPSRTRAVQAAMGEDATITEFQIHVHSAQAGQTLNEFGSFGNDGDTVETDGVWVVVDLSYAAITASAIPSDIALMDDQGRLFPTSSRADGRAWLAGPDIWVRGQLAFEVAPDSLGSLRLALGELGTGPTSVPVRYLEVPLGLDPNSVAESVDLLPSQVLGVGER